MPVEALRGIPWTLVTYAATRVLTVVTTLVLARLLVPADFGLFAMATLGMELLSVFSGLWLGAALVVRKDMDARAEGTVLTLLIGAGALFAVILLILAPVAAAFFGEGRLAGIVAVLAAVLVVSGVNWFYETLFQRELAFRRRFACQIARTLVFSATALGLAAAGAGVWSLVLAYLAGHIANGVALLALAPYRVRPAFDRGEARRTLRSGRGFLAQDLATFLGENADYLAVGRILGPSQLGFYSMAYRQAELPHWAIAEPVGKVTFPAFAQMRHRGEDVGPAFLKAIGHIALVTCPIGVILSAAAVPFAVALLGSEWLPMAAPLAILGIWAVIRPLQVTVGNLLNSLARAQVYGRVSMVSLVPLVVATFVAAGVGGVTAVAWVLLAHVTVVFTVLVLLAGRSAGVSARAQARALWPFATATVVSWGVTHEVATAAGTSVPALALAAAVVACVASYLVVLAVLAPSVLTDALRGARRALGWPTRDPALRRRRSRAPALAMVCAVLLGALAGADPKMALALAGGALLLALPFAAPVVHLVLLVLITAIVPFDALNATGFSGGPGSPSVLVPDLLLLGGLLRAGLMLLDTPLGPRSRWAIALVATFLAAAVLQAVHGLGAGFDAGTAGTELRVLLGFGAAVIALPIIGDPAARARLFRGFVAVGLAVGLWGLVQWTVDLPFTTAEDAGVREGVRFATTGSGQIQGGLFAFPVMVVVGLAALLSHELRSGWSRALVIAVVGLNALDLVLTYERTFWLATLAALCFLAAKATREQRHRVLAVGPVVVGAVLAGMALFAPADLTAAKDRLLSLGQYGSDLSVRFRLTETRNVVREIEAAPLVGSGLGATIVWGRAYEGVEPTTEPFAHNGYLWLTWKLGVPAALLLVVILLAAVLSRGPPTTTTLGAVGIGAQAALLLLLTASVTFPAFNTLGITSVMGVLLAICVLHRQAGDRASAESRRASRPSLEPSAARP